MPLAEATSEDLDTLWILLAFVCFAAGLYLAVVPKHFPAALAAALIGVLVIIFAV